MNIDCLGTRSQGNVNKSREIKQIEGSIYHEHSIMSRTYNDTNSRDVGSSQIISAYAYDSFLSPRLKPLRVETFHHSDHSGSFPEIHKTTSFNRKTKLQALTGSILLLVQAQFILILKIT